MVPGRDGCVCIKNYGDSCTYSTVGISALRF